MQINPYRVISNYTVSWPY